MNEYKVKFSKMTFISIRKYFTHSQQLDICCSLYQQAAQHHRDILSLLLHVRQGKKTVNKRELKDKIKLFIKTEKKNRNKNKIIIIYKYLQCNYSLSANNTTIHQSIPCNVPPRPSQFPNSSYSLPTVHSFIVFHMVSLGLIQTPVPASAA